LAENIIEPISYLYTYSCHEDEISLCSLERRMIFGDNTDFLEELIRHKNVRSYFTSRFYILRDKIKLTIT
jgi:hypothetical protein